MEDTNSVYVDLDEPINIFENVERVRSLNEEMKKEGLFELEECCPSWAERFDKWSEGKETKIACAIMAALVVSITIFFSV